MPARFTVEIGGPPLVFGQVQRGIAFRQDDPCDLEEPLEVGGNDEGLDGVERVDFRHDAAEFADRPDRCLFLGGELGDGLFDLVMRASRDVGKDRLVGLRA